MEVYNQMSNWFSSGNRYYIILEIVSLYMGIPAAKARRDGEGQGWWITVCLCQTLVRPWAEIHSYTQLDKGSISKPLNMILSWSDSSTKLLLVGRNEVTWYKQNMQSLRWHTNTEHFQTFLFYSFALTFWCRNESTIALT